MLVGAKLSLITVLKQPKFVTQLSTLKFVDGVFIEQIFVDWSVDSFALGVLVDEGTTVRHRSGRVLPRAEAVCSLGSLWSVALLS